MSIKYKYNIFMSYSSDDEYVKENLCKLFDNLKNKNYNLWIESENIKNENRFIEGKNAMLKGIEDSNVFICCISKQYASNEFTKLQFNYAIALQKPILCVLIEELTADDVEFFSKVTFNFKFEKCLKHTDVDKIVNKIDSVVTIEKCEEKRSETNEFNSNVPYQRDNNFLDKTYVKQIDELFKEDNTRIIALEGPSGVGKTSCAVEYAYFQTNAVARWFDCDFFEKIEIALKEIYSDLFHEDADLDLKILTPKINENLAKRAQKILFIFDNCVSFDSISHILKDLPSNVYVIITTRNSDFDQSNKIKKIKIEPFTEADALSYMKKTYDWIEKSHLSTIFHEVAEGIKPANLQILMSYLAFNKNDTATSLVKDFKQILDSIMDQLMENKSYNNQTLNILSLLKYVDERNLSFKFVKDVLSINDDTLKQAIEVFNKFSLINYFKICGKWSAISFVSSFKEAIISKLDNYDNQEKVLDALLLNFPSIDHIGKTNWSFSALYWPHAIKFFECTTKKNKNVAALWIKVGKYEHYKRHSYNNALDAYNKALKIYDELQDNHHPDAVICLNNLGMIHQTLDDVNKALEYFEKGLEINKIIYKDAHYDIARSYNIVAMVYEALGDTEKGLVHQKEALKILETLYKYPHPAVAASLDNLGVLYQSLGDIKTGIENLERALDIYRKIYPTIHPDTAMCINIIGMAYESLGEIKKSLVYQEEALKMHKEIYDGPNPIIVVYLNNIGMSYQSIGNNEKALEFLEEALAMSDSLFEGSHHTLITCLTNVGMAYHNLGDTSKAIKYHKEALDMAKCLYEIDSTIATSLNNLGMAYMSLGDGARALEFYENALNIYLKFYDAEHPDIAKTLNNIGMAYESLGDTRKGLEYLENSLKMKRLLYDEPHPDIAKSLNNIGAAYEDLGDIKKGLEYQEAALNMYELLYDEGNITIATCLNNVAMANHSLGNHDKALELLEKSLTILNGLFKNSHPSIAMCLNNLGLVYDGLGDSTKGLEYLEKALDTSKSFYTEDHPDIVNYLDNVGRANQSRKEYEKSLNFLIPALEMKKRMNFSSETLAESSKNIGLVYERIGNYNEALVYYENVLNIYRTLYEKEDHPKIVDCASIIEIIRKKISCQ